MQLPNSFLDSLESVEGFNKDSFIRVHESGEQVTSIRINPFKVSESSKVLPLGEDLGGAIPWCENGFYLQERPSFTFDPLFHAGCYYVQEASSMFLEQALKQTVDLSKPLKVLDLCAAPGGKSTHILSLITKDSLLVSNEVIRSRSNILNDNIIKWGCGNVVVTNNDPKEFQRLEDYFDVIVVDAPCSGSGLFRKDPEAINEWSLNNVALCSQRQQRILADVLSALKPGGVLIYSTCSYSKEEDEEIVRWLQEELIINNEELIIDPLLEIVPSGGGYRFWPDKIKGEGFFLACFRKRGKEDLSETYVRYSPDKFSETEMSILDNYVVKEGMTFFRDDKMIHAVPETLASEIKFLIKKHNVINFGIRIGEIIRDKLIPDHALAMSGILSEKVIRTTLDLDQAILYLQRKEMNISLDKKGWGIVNYKGFSLGWINVLQNRLNNYYPKELRILKQ